MDIHNQSVLSFRSLFNKYLLCLCRLFWGVYFAFPIAMTYEYALGKERDTDDTDNVHSNEESQLLNLTIRHSKIE